MKLPLNPFRLAKSSLTIAVPLGLFLLLGCFQSHVAADPDHPRVIFISCDGTRPDAITALGPEGAPTFFRLRKEAAFTDNARTDYDYTVTLPNHTCMITSRGVVGKEGHEWIKNTDPMLGENLHRNHHAYISSMFQVAHDHGLKTALFASKSKFSLYDISYGEQNGAADETGEDNGRDKLDIMEIDSDTSILVDKMIASMEQEPIDLMMLHLRDPDSAGHAKGWNLTAGSEYMEAVSLVDSLIGKLLDAVNRIPGYKGNTYLVITADHGGWRGTRGHGESTQKDNYSIPYYVWGPGVAAGANLYHLNSEVRKDPGARRPDYTAPMQPIRNGDSGNLALKLLGLPPIPGSTINSKQDLTVKTDHSMSSAGN